MLDILPVEVTLNVLSHLPIPWLLSLPILSHQWSDLFSTNESEIFHSAAIFHEYIKPEIMSLEDALSVNTGRPWAGSTSWKDFCKSLLCLYPLLPLIIHHQWHFPNYLHCEGYRSFQFHKNWEGRGRAVARVVMPPGSNAKYIKIDEKAGICIATSIGGTLTVAHLSSGTSLWCLPKVRESFLKPT